MPGPVSFQFKASGQKDVENAFKGITAAAEKSSKSVIAETKQQAKALNGLGKDIAKTAKDIEKARVQASKSATQSILADYEKQAKAAEKLAERMEKSFSKVAGKGGVGKAGSVASGFIGANVVMSAAKLAYDTVSSAAREAIKLDEIATRVSVNGRMAGGTFADKNDIRKQAQAIAIANPGQKSEDILGGVLAFQSKTGETKLAQQLQGTWATMANASGAKIEDIAKASADLFEKFDVKTVDEMQEALARLYAQGKEGSFELKDAADQYARLASAASRFNFGKGFEAAATLGGLTQIAKRATGSPEEASTAVERMLSSTIEHSAKLGGHGVKVFDKAGRTNNIQDILVDSISKVGGNNMAQKKVKLGELFGDRGIRAISPLMSIYEDTYMKAKGEKKTDAQAMAAGQEALRAEFEKTIGTTSSFTEVEKDAAQIQKTSSAILEGAWEQLKSSVSDELVPALIKVAPKFLELADTAMPAAVVLFTALVEAGNDFLDILKLMGLVKPKTITKEQEYQKAKKEYDTFNKELEKKGLAATPEDIARRNELGLKVAAADNARWSGMNKTLTSEEFAKEYDKLGDGSWYRSATGKDTAQQILKDPKGGRFTNDMWQSMDGETPAQRNLRMDYQSQITAEKRNQSSSATAQDYANNPDFKSVSVAFQPAVDNLNKAADNICQATKNLPLSSQ